MGFNEDQPVEGERPHLSSGGSGQGSHHAPLLASSTSSSSNTPLSTPYPPAAAAGVGGFGGPNGATPAPPPPPFPPPLSPTAPFFQMPPPTRFSLLPFSFSLPFTSLLPSAGHQIGVPVPASQPFPPQPYSPQQSPTSPPPHAWAAASAAIPPPPFLATHAGAAAAAVGTPVNAWASQPYSQPIGTRVAFSRSPTLLHFTIPPQRFSFKALPEIVFALFSCASKPSLSRLRCLCCLWQFWTAFVAFWTFTAATSGAPLFFALFSIPFWAVGIGLLAHSVLRHIMDETVTVDSSTCQLTILRSVKGQTLPFFGLSSVHTALIHGAGINNTMQHHHYHHDSWEHSGHYHHHHHSPPITFCQLTMAGGETLSFGARLSLAEQRWLSLHVASFLQVPWFEPPFLHAY
ncbi:hypothetical protein CLOM_g11108 [Closterium sp. NIES-68]|nr:hypothetical protein CLOM_g11108 [Closterium sp. NIES-68]